MKIYRIANLAVLSFVLSIGFAAAVRANDKAVPGWDPAVFRDASTIKIMTTEPDVREHWSNLWVVVIDGQPYVRLGDRAYGRIQGHHQPLREVEGGGQGIRQGEGGGDAGHEAKGRRRDGRQVLDGHPRPARVAFDGRAPGSGDPSIRNAIALIAIPDLLTELFVATATWRRTPWLISS